MTAILELKSVGMIYPGPPAVEALRPTDLVVNAGDHVAVVGRSGSGKSTLLAIMGLLTRPTVGRVLVDGSDVVELNDADMSQLRGAVLGFVFQAFHLLSNRTALENVELPLVYQRCTPTERRRRALEALDRVGMAHRASSLTALLSGGERQRTAIARAIVGEPKALLCDEPTGNLDEESARLVLETLHGLNRDGVSLIVVTHAADVASAAHRCLRLGTFA